MQNEDNTIKHKIAAV